jgi:hypothetical protein
MVNGGRPLVMPCLLVMLRACIAPFCLVPHAAPSLVAWLLVSGCSGSLGAALNAYHRADYPQAAREFRLASRDGLAPGDAGRFHLYCGLNHLALGNADLAMAHLSSARATLDRDADYFSLDERARLSSAWRSLGRMPGQPLFEHP